MRARPTPKGKPAARGRVPAPAMTATTKAESSREIVGKLLARGVTRKEAAGRLGLSQQAIYAMFPVGTKRAVALAPVPVEVVAPPPPPPVPVPAALVATVTEGHLIGFDYRHLPGPLTAEEEAARRSPGWCRRMGESRRIEDIAAGQSGAVQAGLLHLADLHRHHARFYSEFRIPASDGLPARYATVPPAGLIGSAGQLCTDG